MSPVRDLPVLLPCATPAAERFIAAVSGTGVDVDVRPDLREGSGLAVIAHDLPDHALLGALRAARRCGIGVVAIDDVAGSLSSRVQRGRARLLADRLVGRWVIDDDLPTIDIGDLLGRLGAHPPSMSRDGVAGLWLGDLHSIVAVHRRSFPEAAMTMLGPAVVDRYYRWQFIGAHPMPFARGAFDDGRLIGILFGGQRRDAVSGFSRRFLPTVAAATLRHPLRARHLGLDRVAGVARLAVRRRRPPGPIGTARSFGVLSIAVVPEARGTGAARDLLAAATVDARNAGFEAMHLTVEAGNARAIRFYEHEGWRPDVVAESSLRMVRDLEEKGSSTINGLAGGG